MKRVAVVYWSGTGNTAAMAGLVAEGARSAGAEVTMFTAGAFDAGQVENFDAIAFGCPAMGRRNWKRANLSLCFPPVNRN